VRIACLNAVKRVPSLGRKKSLEESRVTTLLWMALYDPDKVKFILFVPNYLPRFCFFCGFVDGKILFNHWI